VGVKNRFEIDRGADEIRLATQIDGGCARRFTPS
jgi:hypothetical protein